MRLDSKECSNEEQRNYEAYCDGVLLKYCLMADEELGCAEVMDTDTNGKIIQDFDSCLGPQTRLVFGKIELRRRD